MFYYTLFIGLTIITIGLTNPTTNILSNEPERCCFPKQYSSKTNFLTQYTLPDGTNYTSNGFYDYAYDERRGIIGMRGITKYFQDNQQSSFWTIFDIINGIIYTITPEENFCYKSNFLYQENNCMPEIATYTNSSNYEYNGKQILADTWLIQTNDTINYFTYSRDKCIPLKTEYFMENLSAVGSSIITDFVESIPDPTIFDIPSECHSY